MPIWKNRVGTCLWSMAVESYVDTPVWEEFVENDMRWNRIGSNLTIVLQAGPPNPSQRKRLAERIQELDQLTAHAFVTDSRITRGVLTVLDWMLTKPYREKAFGSLRDAMEWLTEVDPTFDREATWKSICETVPSDVRTKLNLL